jgi:HEAT repeat protein
MNGFNLLAALFLVGPVGPLLPPIPERAPAATPSLSSDVRSALEDLKRSAEIYPRLNDFVPSHLVEGLTPASPNESNVPRDPERAHLPDDLIRDCSESIACLAKSTDAVDAALLRLAHNDPRLPTRWRATWVLAMRGHPGAVSAFEKMAASQSANERTLAWRTYEEAIAADWLPPPKDVTFLLRRFQAGEDSPFLPTILGHARAAEAVPLFLARLKAGPGNDYTVLLALGKIATPEAVRYLIDQLEVGDGDVIADALALSRSTRTVPALTAHLARLKRQPEPNTRDLAATRVALLCVSKDDPRDDLLRLAEDSREELPARRKALLALRRYDLGTLVPRILNLYATGKDCYFRRDCVEVLQNQKHPDITETMLVLARNPYNRDDPTLECADALLRGLNHRLHTSFFSLRDLLKAHDPQSAENDTPPDQP